MDKVLLKDLKMNSRAEVLRFLKKLWTEDGADCPFCGERLELLHKKAKKSNCDGQCKHCEKVFRTINLLDELNDQRDIYK